MEQFMRHLPLCHPLQKSRVTFSSYGEHILPYLQIRNSTQNCFWFFPLNVVGHYLNVDAGAYPNKVLHSPGRKHTKPGNRTHSSSESTTAAQRLNKAVESRVCSSTGFNTPLWTFTPFPPNYFCVSSEETNSMLSVTSVLFVMLVNDEHI